MKSFTLGVVAALGASMHTVDSFVCHSATTTTTALEYGRQEWWEGTETRNRHSHNVPVERGMGGSSISRYGDRRSSSMDRYYDNDNGYDNGYDSSSRIHGNARRTFPSRDPYASSSQIRLESDRPYTPLMANVRYHSGPSHTSRQMNVYSEDGFHRPVTADFTNGYHSTNNGYGGGVVDVRNTGPMEFPVRASVRSTRGGNANGYYSGYGNGRRYGSSASSSARSHTIQGGSLKTYTFDGYTESVRVALESDSGMPVAATIEVLQGPGSARQSVEVNSDDGSHWNGVVAVPGYGSTIIIRNTGPLEFPIRCRVEEDEQQQYDYY